jgi:hypothetical protein
MLLIELLQNRTSSDRRRKNSGTNQSQQPLHVRYLKMFKDFDIFCPKDVSSKIIMSDKLSYITSCKI